MVNDRSAPGRRILLGRLNARMAEEPAWAGIRATGANFVPGDGPTFPRLMFVGEAPGKQEDKARRPFVGASGRLLTEMLESVGLRREDVYITNVVKYRPDKFNRDPTDEERHAGLGWLRKEHRIIGRPPIVLLGKHARNYLTGVLAGHPVGKWLWMQWDGGYPVLPLHHPARALYQASMRPLLFDQFKAVLAPPQTRLECE